MIEALPPDPGSGNRPHRHRLGQFRARAADRRALSDRHDTRPGTLGFLLAVVGVGSVGYLQNYARNWSRFRSSRPRDRRVPPSAAAAVGQLLHTRFRAMACFTPRACSAGARQSAGAAGSPGSGHDAAGVYSPAIGLGIARVPGALWAGLCRCLVGGARRAAPASRRPRAPRGPPRLQGCRCWNAIGLPYVANVPVRWWTTRSSRWSVKEGARRCRGPPRRGLCRRPRPCGPGDQRSVAGGQTGRHGHRRDGLGFLPARWHERAALIAAPLLGHPGPDRVALHRSLARAVG